LSYFAICTFDLEKAIREDYQNAYADLAEIGFSTTLEGSSGNEIKLPTTMTAGEFEGQSGGAVRDALRARVKEAFSARGFKSEIFVSVGDSWAWGHTTT